jgi:hypothetical protein
MFLVRRELEKLQGLAKHVIILAAQVHTHMNAIAGYAILTIAVCSTKGAGTLRKREVHIVYSPVTPHLYTISRSTPPPPQLNYRDRAHIKLAACFK